MRKIISLLVVILLLSMQSKADYLHWLYWVSNPSHGGTVQEYTDIAYGLSNGTIKPNVVYRLTSGETYKIPKPELYLSYLVKVVKKVDPSTTSENLYKKIRESVKTRWDNNFPGTVNNYFYSLVSNSVTYRSNYSGRSEDVDILVLNGMPIIKCDCGNPLENEMPPLPSVETPSAPAHKEEIPAARYEPVQARYEPYRIEEPKQPVEKPVVVKEEKKHRHLVLKGLALAGAYFGVKAILAGLGGDDEHGSGSNGRGDTGNNGTGSGGRRN